jgi:acyl-CoA synthetase (AMP-forming)/AMP-acid ligase II
MQMSPASLIDVLERRSATTPDRPALIEMARDGRRRQWSYNELDRRARDIAAAVASTVGPGEPVLLLVRSPLELAAALFGVLRAAAIPVPVAAPPGALAAAFALESALRTTCAAGCVSDGLRWPASCPPLPEVDLDLVRAGSGALRPEPPRDRPDTAYLQLTSGSQGEQRAVEITHGNAIAGCRQLASAQGDRAEDRAVHWVSLGYSMGIVCGLLRPLWTGYPSTLLDPTVFGARPASWLTTIRDQRATLTSVPVDGCRRLVRERAFDRIGPRDLASLRVLRLAAEPMDPAAIDALLEAGAPRGLAKTVLCPSYGLSEATLAVSATRPGEGPRRLDVSHSALIDGAAVATGTIPDRRTLISSGRPVAGVDLRVVDPHGHAVAEGTVGELWVSGPNVARRYWLAEDASRATFGLELDGVPERTFCRTGDLGFVREGHVFVVGRMRDSIDVRGRKVGAEMLERAILASVPAGTILGCVAFAGWYAGRHGLVCVLEGDPARAAPTETAAAVRAAVGRFCGAQPSAIVWVGPGQIPRTGSGKVRRGECRARLEASRLPVTAVWSDGATGPSL